MHHHQRGGQRHAEVQHADAGLPCNHVDQLNQQDEADFEEYRDAGDEADEHHCPRGIAFPQPVQQCGGDAPGTSGFLQQFAEDTAQADDAGKKAQRAAHAFLECRHDCRWRHAGADTDHQACGHQGQKRVYFEFADHDDDQEYRGAQDE
ncbi:hypothetical protein D9M71_544620 [compost metagenome]